MSRQYKDGSCSCWKSVNKTLEELGGRLSERFSLSGHRYLSIETEKINSSNRNKPAAVASYCPFCGNKLKEGK